ncbi:MAG: TlpA family protein disulfide reductase [Flavobacteriaceae bacterium]
MKYFQPLCILLFFLASISMVLGQNKEKILKGLTLTDIRDVANPFSIEQNSYDANFDRIPYEWAVGMINAQFVLGKKYPIDYYTDTKDNLKVTVFPEITNLDEQKKSIVQAYQNFYDKRLADSKWIDQALPPFALRDLSDEINYLAKYTGKVVVINFWYIKCGPCFVEIPALNELVADYKKNKDVVFLAFSAQDTAAEIQDFLKENPFNYQHIPEAAAYAGELDIYAYPTHLIIDPNGKIRFMISGIVPTFILKAKINEALQSIQS